jgi:hypothetical protein
MKEYVGVGRGEHIGEARGGATDGVSATDGCQCMRAASVVLVLLLTFIPFAILLLGLCWDLALRR